VGRTEPRRKPCAVYTWKSAEEGLEHDFNCPDAQREGCLAYIPGTGLLPSPTLLT
jgi:hypothetical protein